ncbi:cytochrome P450 [Streptomyces sp. NBC_00091]|uniref:cytochrome P450 n=1 Tax=Streptomyces sp. NBC_00091 TaxID=2975648 RepID=UPI002256CFAE|nr:cytochrome P450 [Streptomyces sp. NBC_00091]MCX5381455.1 cytochrome P450 [Streptomyces sp. NBC_00091]
MELATFNPFGQDHKDLYRTLDWARAHQPIFFSEALNAWCITRYDDVREIAGDPQRFSSESAIIRPTGLPPEAAKIVDFIWDNLPITLTDAPEHRFVRRVAHAGFGARATRQYEDGVRAIIQNEVDARAIASEFDVAEFAHTIALRSVLHVMGIDPKTTGKWSGWLADIHSIMFGSHTHTPDQLAASGNRCAPAIDYLIDLADRRIASPQNDLASAWGAVTIDGRKLSRSQLANLLFSFIVAGWESTADALSNIVHTLLHTGVWNDLAAGRLDSEAAVQEGLRFDSSVIGTFRTVVHKGTEFRGINFQQADLMLLLYCSANRDEAHYKAPQTYDPYCPRSQTAAMAFGYGIHNCAGAPLAKMELNFAIELLVQRFPNLELASHLPPAPRQLSIFKGPQSLHVKTNLPGPAN